jgi:uncharacterized protein (TIGR02466 family)
MKRHLPPLNGTLADPFPRLIWKFNYEFPYSTLLPLIEEVKQKTPENSLLEQGQAFSTASQQSYPPHMWDVLEDFREWLIQPIDFMWKEFEFRANSDATVLNSWINTHKKTGVTLEHNHNQALFVVTSYLNLPKDSGYIEFRDPLEYHKGNTPMDPEETLWKSIPCKTNDVLIFPAWLKHRTQPNNTDEERIVMTWNVG